MLSGAQIAIIQTWNHQSYLKGLSFQLDHDESYLKQLKPMLNMIETQQADNASNEPVVGTYTAPAIDKNAGPGVWFQDSIDEAGRSIQYGTSGNDVFKIFSNDQTVSESADGGNADLVVTTVDFVLTDNVENLSMKGSDDIFGVGNDMMNKISGNAGDNIIAGNGGFDRLYGGDGDDIIIGGKDFDRMIGGNGADTFVIQAGDSGNKDWKADLIEDFKLNEDQLILEREDGRKVGEQSTVIETTARSVKEAYAAINEIVQTGNQDSNICDWSERCILCSGILMETSQQWNPVFTCRM